MKTCKNCGKPLDKDSTFCTNCGNKTIKQEDIEPKHKSKRTYKFPIIILIILIIALGIIVGKDTIMYNYYLSKANKETLIPQSIEYYASALKLKYETTVITKVSEKLKQDDDFEETIKIIEPSIKSEDLKKIYTDIYVKKARINFKEKNYEATSDYLSKAQEYGYKINDFEYYKDLQKIQQEAQKPKEEPQIQSSNNNVSQLDSYKQKYINKLDDIEISLSDLDYLYQNGITSELLEAEGIKLVRWDDMLNEIYGLLKVQLSESEMSALRTKQLNWIKYRDKTAENEAKNEAGDGTLYLVVYNSALARLTKERCYELVNIYMK